MSLEQTLERIADSLEKLVDLQAGRNLILEASSTAAQNLAADTIGQAQASAAAAEPEKPKRTRKAKEEPAPAAQPETPAADEPAASGDDSFGDEGDSFGDEPEAPAVTHDDVRKLFGELSAAGKRNDAVKVIKGKHGFNGVSEIKDEKLGEIFAELKALA